MPKVTILKGLPASGKSTWAMEQCRQNPNLVRTNKDEYRESLQKITKRSWNPRDEKIILNRRDADIKQALCDGMDVVVDDTNFSPKHEKTIRAIAESFGAEVEVKFLDTLLNECIARDAKREKPVGKKVIVDMYNKYLYKEPPTVPFNPELANCVLCDIDGTLAKNVSGRSPYDESRVGEDEIRWPIQQALQSYSCARILVSGRSEACRNSTIQWLIKNHVGYDYLYMRPAGDRRPDTVVKKEIYENYIENRWNVQAIYDDRLSVCRMWTELGFGDRLFRVGPVDRDDF